MKNEALSKDEKIIPVILFFTAFAIRFLFLDETASSPVFLLNTLRGTDMAGYLRWAAAVSRGVYESESAFWQAPLYPYFAAMVFKLSGINIYIVSLVQVFLSSLTCVLIYFIGRAAFNKKTAAAAGFISCFYAPFIFYSPVMLSETLGVFLISAALYPIIKSDGNPALKHIVPGGILLGLASLARPNFLLFAPLFLLYIFLKTKDLKKFSFYFVPFSLSALAVILPVTIRNYAVSGEFVLISGNFYETFRLSNSFDSLVLNYTEPSLPLMPLDSGAFWLHQLRKAVYFWWGLEVPQNVNYYLFSQYSKMLNLPLIPFWLIAPTAIAGIGLWFKSEYRQNKTLVIYVLSYYASIIVLYIISRFRLPIMAGLIPFAGFAAARTADFFKKKKFKAAAAVILLCAAASAASYPWNVARIRPNDYNMLGVAMVQEGLYEEALEPLRKSLDMLPPNEREATKNLIRRIEELPAD